jgi:hypothetical protein
LFYWVKFRGSAIEYNAKVISAETIARVLGGEEESTDNSKNKDDYPIGESSTTTL